MYRPCFVYLFIVCRLLGCSPPLAVVNDAAGNVVLFEALVPVPFSTLPEGWCRKWDGWTISLYYSCKFSMRLKLHKNKLPQKIRISLEGLPWWLIGKESTCQWGRRRFDPWSRKIPWKKKWQPTPLFLPGNPVGGGAWWATVHRVAKESDMTERLMTTIKLSPNGQAEHPKSV